MNPNWQRLGGRISFTWLAMSLKIWVVDPLGYLWSLMITVGAFFILKCNEGYKVSKCSHTKMVKIFDGEATLDDV